MAKGKAAKAEKAAKVTKAGRQPKFEDGARPGDTLKREYHDEMYSVVVKADGFHFGGEVYTSLSKIASSLTKQSTNGPLWFGLRQTAEEQRKGAAPAKKAKAAKAAPAPAKA